MAISSFKSYNIASNNAAQPLLGTTLSANVNGGIVIDPISVGSGNPIGPVITVSVGDTSMFDGQDALYLDVGASAEKLIVQSQPASGNALSLRPTKNHNNGAYVSLAAKCSSVTVYGFPSNSGTLYLFAWNRAFLNQPGNGRASLAPSMSNNAPGTGNACLIAEISKGNSFTVSEIYGQPGSIQTETLWIGGTPNDNYTAFINS